MSWPSRFLASSLSEPQAECWAGLSCLQVESFRSPTCSLSSHPPVDVQGLDGAADSCQIVKHCGDTQAPCDLPVNLPRLPLYDLLQKQVCAPPASPACPLSTSRLSSHPSKPSSLESLNYDVKVPSAQRHLHTVLGQLTFLLLSLSSSFNFCHQLCHSSLLFAPRNQFSVQLALNMTSE